MTDPLVSIRGLSKSFLVHARQRRVHAAQEVHLQLQPGTITVLLGPSGVGKSSILKCIWRSYLPSSGSILYRDAAGAVIDLARCPEEEVLRLRRSEMAFVTQFLHAPPRQEAWEVVAMPLLEAGVPVALARCRAEALLDRLGVPRPLWGLPPATFSGGERQRVNLARGLVRQPRLLLLDEPTASLDAAAAGIALALVQQARDEGATVLAVLHDRAAAEELADQRCELTAVEVA